MANFIFDTAKHKILDRSVSGTMNLETNSSGVVGSDCYRVILLKTTKLTAATHGTAAEMEALFNMSGVTELPDSIAGYDVEGKPLVSAEWAASATPATGGSSFTFLKAEDITWSGLGAVTDDPIVGALLYIDTGNNQTGVPAAADFPVAYFDFDAQPDGGNLVLQWGNVAGATTSGAQGVVLKIG